MKFSLAQGFSNFPPPVKFLDVLFWIIWPKYRQRGNSAANKKDPGSPALVTIILILYFPFRRHIDFLFQIS